ncbi:magnesium chelatase subunit D family protein [Arachnia propionica]|uniref:Mg-protoporphyrin IX chelatase n=1 Tax=Arachnia propionica TaxID=1750 RepID=A0A3P1WYP2_9ACTN|nr:magnesium chelatase subunit D family protein [Arachnia propionica]RRD51361.1 VWA domain-containing protein [Arachnia propionica]
MKFPFTAVLGADDMARALILASISPEIGGVLVRGEKGTAKSTIVRGLTEVLPEQRVLVGCRFRCDPDHLDADCMDLDVAGREVATVAVPLVELPVGASEDRVTGSLDLQAALGKGETAFEPGLLAAAHRGILYVDEVNLLHDHLVDLLLDAAAMGRNTVERDGVSVSHAARFMLVGTMNPEEGELRPQLLDRFGLTVEVHAPRDPQTRVGIVRRRMAFDADAAGFRATYAEQQEALARRIAAAQRLVGQVELSDAMLAKIAEVCAAFDVDGMRADIVTARAAVANAAWEGRSRVTKADIRVAALLSLPHRRRRKPFDAPGLDEELLDQLLGDDEPEPEPEPPTDPDQGPDEDSPRPGDATPEQPSEPPAPETPEPPEPQDPGRSDTPEPPEPTGLAPVGLATADAPFRPRVLRARGLGEGTPGRRSRALTSHGRVVGVDPRARAGAWHVPATIKAAAPRQAERGKRVGQPLRIQGDDVRRARREGRESNLVLFVVDASGSMGARRRMAAVKTAILSLLLDAYQRRDKVGMVTFRGEGAELALPPTTSVEAAAARLDELPHGGRTPLAEGLECAAQVLATEAVKDPTRRPIVVLLSDGRATAGKGALARSRAAADALAMQGLDCVVIDCESGPMRLGLAGDLAARLGAELVPMAELDPAAITDVVRGQYQEVA